MIDVFRWKGRLQADQLSIRGEFLRLNVVMRFSFRFAVSCTAICDMEGGNGKLRITKGSRIEIMVRCSSQILITRVTLKNHFYSLFNTKRSPSTFSMARIGMGQVVTQKAGSV